MKLKAPKYTVSIRVCDYSMAFHIQLCASHSDLAMELPLQCDCARNKRLEEEIGELYIQQM